MYNHKHKSKIKNDKISRWRVELSQYKFDIVYCPGKENTAADALSRIIETTHSVQELRDLHEKLCLPGVTRLYHFVRHKNLPFSQAQVKQVKDSCPSCLYSKPKFPKSQGCLIKAILPFQRLSVDFKGPLPASKNRNIYKLTNNDENTRFPFAYPCKDITSKTVLNCFSHLFSIFGMPDMIHSDRGASFLSAETTDYLHSKGIATSRTSRYNPGCNGQVEKLNGTLWKGVQVTLLVPLLVNVGFYLPKINKQIL